MRARLVRAFRDLPFRGKLFVAFLAIGVVPLLALGTYSFRQSQVLLRRQATASLDNAIVRTTQEIGAWLGENEVAIRFLVFSTRLNQIFSNPYVDLLTLGEDYREYLDPFFNVILNLRPDVRQITFYSKRGLPEYGTAVLAFDRVADLPWATNPLIYQATTWLRDGEELLAARGVRDLFSSRDLGVLTLRILCDRIPWMAMDVAIQDASILLDTREGNVILSRGAAEQLRTVLGEAAPAASDRPVRVAGSSHFVFAHEIPDAPWRLAVAVPVRRLSIDPGRILVATALIVLFCLLSLAFLIWLFSTTLVKRIHSLNHTMARVAEGRLDIEIGRDSTDEIGDLAERFGSMLTRVKELMDEVRDREIVQREAELKALTAQINPHFLYNTLSMINWKALEIDAGEISAIALALSRFYRTALNKGRNVITVRDELDNTRAYLDIQGYLHDGDIAMRFDIDASVYRYSTLNLMLQPVVENAIEHGLERSERSDRWIGVSARVAEEGLEFVVEDNGVGMDATFAAQALGSLSRGYGLKNVNDRIKLFFGPSYGIAIASEPGRGTTVTIRVPRYLPDTPAPSGAGN